MPRVDLHSHLIPGVDDGVRTLDDALRCIEGLVERGYDCLCTTPHQADRWRPDAAFLTAALRGLREEIDRRGWPVRLALGAENHLDEVFLTRLEQGTLPTYGLAGRDVLVECPVWSRPPFLEEILFRLQTGGIRPVLAHPERYPWLVRDRARVAALRNAGCLFQVDLGSFAGAYGSEARQAARRLVREKAVDLVATDLHGAGRLPALVDAGWQALAELAGPAELARWGSATPGEIFARAWTGAWGQEIAHPPEPSADI